MTSFLLSLIILNITYYFSLQKNISDFSIISHIIQDEYNSNLREWLSKLIIDLPNDLIKDETQGYLEDLTIYGITLDKIITTSPETIDNKVGVKLSVQNAALDIKGIFTFITSNNFVAHISNLNIDLPFYLVRNKENGLVSEVDTSGFNIDLDNVEIDLRLEVGDIFRNLVVGILKGILKLIKTSVIEKNLIETMNTKFFELFQKVNLNGVEPKELNSAIKEQDRTDLKNLL